MFLADCLSLGLVLEDCNLMEAAKYIWLALVSTRLVVYSWLPRTSEANFTKE
ncbi:predicted protein [Sclerotinia sclerotiorum 1980 UF-70]|uniref:Uncharacterized protein n=1 Tax=Sclerotinia sclerotiorum (strain ATCC 18683 / 1980 / Ss-1) TaxID=665079 RepID=A7ECZ3_SCLS1|nr:predicted protein [Sclerotinia sclerotiorum 1980 UF-70]EDO00709.1 predicted protein [Sclerotinia sclerotiorum 1980 UF-70]